MNQAQKQQKLDRAASYEIWASDQVISRKQ